MLMHQTTFSSAYISIDSVVSVHCEPCKHCAASEPAESQYFLDKTGRDKDAIFQSQCPQRKLKWRKQGNAVSHPALFLHIPSVPVPLVGGGSDILISPSTATFGTSEPAPRCPASLSEQLVSGRCQRSPRPSPASLGTHRGRWFTLNTWLFPHRPQLLAQHRAQQVICEGSQAGRPVGRQAGRWVKPTTVCQRKILFSALLKTLDHRIADHCV